MDKLKEALQELKESDYYPFHMPGHKRREKGDSDSHPYLEDITEIDGFDNLHHPEGIIKTEQEFAAKAFGAEESFFLVNGSSCGVLAAIAAVSAAFEKKILMGRNGHKSAYNGLYFADTGADYLYPHKIPGVSFPGAVSPEDVFAAVNGDASSYSAVFLTSPTYEGVVSDVEEICKIAHGKNIPVIVDEAHGAHLGLWGGDGYFPRGALCQGADIVIESLHKTLPAMTQTAILHVQGGLVDRERLKLYLAMFQSSSPSYVLMGSISSCVHFCVENGRKLLEDYKKRLQDFYERTKNLTHLSVAPAVLMDNSSGIKISAERDPGKIIIGTGKSGLNGKALYKLFREKYHLQMEMAATDYVLAMTSVMDTEDGFERLICALQEMDLQMWEKEAVCGGSPMPGKAEALCSIREGLTKASEPVEFEKSVGKISGEFIYLYPPGIPVIVPGEVISEEVIAYLKEADTAGLAIQGMRDYGHKKICCIKNE